MRMTWREQALTTGGYAIGSVVMAAPIGFWWSLVLGSVLTILLCKALGYTVLR